MSTHIPELKDGDQSFGLFYPRNYILAGFTDAASANTAADALRQGGFAGEDVHVVSGSALVAEIEKQEQDAGWFDRIRANISEFIGTETYFIDQDVTLARAGGSFVLVYTPDDDTAERAKPVVHAHRPEYARRYRRMAIERIVEPDNTDDVQRRHSPDDS